MKAKNFTRAQEKIIRKNIPITVAVGVHSETHTQVKNEMRDVKGFKADSDYGLCYRVVRFLVCEKIAGVFPGGARIDFLLE